MKTLTFFDLTLEKCFNIFDREKQGQLRKEEFLKCIQGMQMGTSIEDIIEFFNYIDDRSENVINKL